MVVERGEIGNNYTSLRNILRSKKRKVAGANKNEAVTEIKGDGRLVKFGPRHLPHITVREPSNLGMHVAFMISLHRTPSKTELLIHSHRRACSSIVHQNPPLR